MKLLLIFPPMWESTQPFLSVPSLTAFMKEKGYDVVQKDLNTEFHDTVTSPEYLKNLIGRKGINLSQADPSGISEKIISQVTRAKENQRNSNFYNPDLYFNSRQVIKGAFQIVSNLYRPTRITDNSFQMKYSSENTAEVLAATRDRKENPFIEFYEDYFLEQVQVSKPDLVGISVTSSGNIIPGFTLSRMIRERFAIPVVIGGFVISSLVRSLSENTGNFELLFDYLVSGEGELPLLKLCEALSGKGSLAEVPSLTYMENSIVKSNPVSAPLPVNELPTPDFDGFPLKKYFAPELVLPLFTSRTCYYKKCAFCDMFFDNKFQLRKPDKVVKDIKTLKEKYDTEFISFSDLTIGAGTCNLLAKKILEEQVKVKWFTTARFEKSYTEANCRNMYNSGCRMLLFGMESASQRVLDLMEKGTTVERTVEILDNTASAGIWAHAFVIFGFPSETRSELQATMDFIFNNHETLDSVGISTFSLNSNAPVAKKPEQYQVAELYHNTSLDLEVNIKKYRTTGGMSEAEVIKTYNRFKLEMWQKFRHPIWMTTSSYATLMLYISYYGRDRLKKEVNLLNLPENDLQIFERV